MNTVGSAAVLVEEAALPSPDEGASPRGAQELRRSPKMAPTDRELMERAKNADISAFEELVSRHEARIHRLTSHLLRSAHEAEDLTQETFLRAYRALARFDGRCEPYTWFYRIAVNLSLNRLRARRTASVVAIADEHVLEAHASDDDPASSAERSQLYASLARGIDALSDTLRTTLVLVCVEGLSHADAAQVLGAPEGTIAWRVHEARRQLKAKLSKDGFDTDGDGT